MDKFNRNYELLVQKVNGEVLKITKPFTIEFDVVRNTNSSKSVGQFRIYNLNPDTRSQLRWDQYYDTDFRTVSFRAGYGENMPFAFIGNMSKASSVREGVNMISEIECYDGGFAYLNATTAENFKSGTSNRVIFRAMMENLKKYGVQPGAIGDYQGEISRGNSYVGSTPDILNQLSGGGFFVDNNKANILKDDEAIEAPTVLINSASGLLGTPLLENQYIHLDMIFEPMIQVGTLVMLETSTATKESNKGQIPYNGLHKVIGVHHKGTISETVCGNAVTSLQLLPGRFLTVSQGA